MRRGRRGGGILFPLFSFGGCDGTKFDFSKINEDCGGLEVKLE
jgi:hypothetical protein